MNLLKPPLFTDVSLMILSDLFLLCARWDLQWAIQVSVVCMSFVVRRQSSVMFLDCCLLSLLLPVQLLCVYFSDHECTKRHYRGKYLSCYLLSFKKKKKKGCYCFIRAFHITCVYSCRSLGLKKSLIMFTVV